MAQKKKDPYQVLGLGKKATQDDIKNAYRRLAKEFHPDLNPGNKEAESNFKDVSHAYEILGRPETRAQFDRGEYQDVPPNAEQYWRKEHPYYYETQEDPRYQHDGRYSYSFANDTDFFESLFGNTRRAGPEVYHLEVSLREAVFGAEKDIALPGPKGKHLVVKIPAGVNDGNRLRLAGEGILLEIHVRPDKRFKHEGDQLITELPISITDAVLGGEVRVPTIDGEVLMKIPPHSNTDKRLRLRERGTYNRMTNRRGDQLVILKVVLPEKIDPELEDFLKTWKQKQVAA